MDGTREIMRRDLDVWSREAGVTRRGFLVAAGFPAVVAVSPAVWTNYDAMMLGPRDAFDSTADFAKYDVIGQADRLAGVDLRIDCGKQDPFYGYVTHLEAALPEPPAGGYSPGGHNSEYWQRVAPGEAEFIGRALGRPAAG